MIPKFRAWDKKGGKYLDPSCVSLTGDGKVHCIQSGYALVTGDEMSGRVSIEQSTGLKDKHGVEIFEGDVVMCQNDRLHEIMYSTSGETAGQFAYSHAQEMDYSYHMRVIGNIYQDSHILDNTE